MANTNIMTSQLYPCTCNSILAGIACAKALASLDMATPLSTDPEALLKRLLTICCQVIPQYDLTMSECQIIGNSSQLYVYVLSDFVSVQI